MTFRSLSCLLFVACEWGVTAPPVPAEVRLDSLGDPLPKGAIARLGTTRLRHSGTISRTVLSPDGRLVASVGSFTDMLCIWDTETGRLLWSMTQKELGSESFAFSPDSKCVAFERENRILFLDAATGKELWRIKSDEIDRDYFGFGPDGLLTISNRSGLVERWNLQSGQLVRRWDYFGGTVPRQVSPLERLTFTQLFGVSADGRLAALRVDRYKRDETTAVELVESTLKVIDLETRREAWRCEADVGDLADTNGTLIATAYTAKEILVRELRTGKVVQRFKTPKGVISLLLSGDGSKVIAYHEDGNLRLWDVAGKLVSVVALPYVECRVGKSALVPMSLSGDGKRLALVGDNFIDVLDGATGKRLPSLPPAGFPIGALGFTSDRRQIFATHNQRWLIATWEAHTWKQAARIEVPFSDKETGFVEPAPGGNRRLTWNRAGQFHIHELWTEKLLLTRKFRTSNIQWVEMSPNGKWLALQHGADKTRITLSLYDVEADRVVGPLARNLQPLYVQFSESGNRVAWREEGGRVWVADLPSGNRVRSFGEIQENVGVTVALSPDGRWLALAPHLPASSKRGEQPPLRVRVWDLDTDVEFASMESGPWWSRGRAFSPDGRMLTRLDGKEVLVWETLSGKERLRLSGHIDSVHASCFSPGGGLLLTGSADTAVLVWDVFAPNGKSTGEPAALWVVLGDLDAKRAFTALRSLVDSPTKTVAFLNDQLHPMKAADPGRLQRSIADLDSRRFVVRDAARRELEQVGELAAPALRKALSPGVALEKRRQIETLLDRVQSPAPSTERFRELRALEVLERIGTPEAAKVLEKLAGGAEGARLTREAKASLDRLAWRVK